ncbi:hypothetical protein Lal_00022301 [Lupinus albus]|nr:hypothetical protein Lal_00022301 [Lupinus albus]
MYNHILHYHVDLLIVGIDRIFEVQLCTQLLLMMLAIVALVQGKTQTPRLYPKLEYQTTCFDLFTVIPVAVTPFTFHYNATTYLALPA